MTERTQSVTEAQSRAYAKCRDYLTRLFGEVNVRETGEALALREGSTFVYVRAFPIGETHSGVEVFSYVATGVRITEELMRFLLEYNLKLTLGGFGLSSLDDGRGSVLLTHTILGESITKEQLYASVSSIAKVADDLDDQIVNRFGGRTAVDQLSEDLHPVRWE